MSFQNLVSIFRGTFDANHNTRANAEQALYGVSREKGFVNACLDLIAHDNTESLVKLAAGINVKNLINGHWSNTSKELISKKNNSDNQNRAIFIIPEEKESIKNRLIQIIIQITDITVNNAQLKYEDLHDMINLKKNQLLPTLSLIIINDFSDKKSLDLSNSFLEVVGNLILNSQNDFAKLHTGVYCMMEIFRNFRWSPNKTRSNILDPIIVKMFPIFLELSKGLLNLECQCKSAEDKMKMLIDELHGELMKFVVKCFKFVTYCDLPAPLRSKETCFEWVNLQLQIINKPLPFYILNLNDFESSDNLSITKSSQWIKSKKWSFANLSKLFIKYGTPLNSLQSSSQSAKEKTYLEFKLYFLEDFVPEILELYFQLIDTWCRGELYLAESCLYHLISFLENCIKINKLWKKYFKTNLENLVSSFLFPTLVLKDSILSISEEDPIEYLHISMDLANNDSGIYDFAALGMITSLVETRKSFSLEIILKICHSNLMNLLNKEETLETAKIKEAVFKIIGAISNVFFDTSTKYSKEIVGFLDQFVIPALLNKYSFVRSRALETISNFSALNFTDEILFKIYQGILVNFGIFNDKSENLMPVISQFISLDGTNLTIDELISDDTVLPVQAESALTLQSFLIHKQFQTILSTDIILVMQRLLNLSERIDLDVISGVMQEIVEMFSQQLQPFGVELMKNLSQQILTIYEEEEDPQEMTNEKIMVVNGIMNTMITIILSFENSNDSIDELENTFYYLTKITLENHYHYFYSEIFELIENSIFLRRSISDIMWNILMESIIEKNFKNDNDPVILSYLTELTPTLSSYLTFGSKKLLENDFYKQNVFEILILILNNGQDKVFQADNFIPFCELSTYFILTIKDQSANYSDKLVYSSINLFLSTVVHQINEDSSININLQNIEYYGNNEVFEHVFDQLLAPKKLVVEFLNLIISGFIYSPINILKVLIKFNFFEKFFQIWFNSIKPAAPKKKSSLFRVIDIKISILGLLSLLSIKEFEEFKLNLITKEIFDNLIMLIEKLPSAIADLEKSKKEFSSDDLYKYDLEDQKLYESHFSSKNEEDEEDDENWLAKEQEYISESGETATKNSFVNNWKAETVNQTVAHNNEDDDDDDDDEDYEDIDDDEDFFSEFDLVDDPLSSNPLDFINIFEILKNSLNKIQIKDANLYQGFVSNLTEKQMGLLQQILN